MRHNSRDERSGPGDTSGRHRTVIAAAVRQQTGPQPAFPSSPTPSTRRRRSSASAGPDAGYDSGPTTRIIFDRDEGQVPKLIPALTTQPPRVSLRPRQVVAQFGQRAAVLSRALVRRPRVRTRDTLIPGAPTTRVVAVIPRDKTISRPVLRTRPVAFLAACVSIVLAITAAGVTAHNQLANDIGYSFWLPQSGVHVLPTPIGGYWDQPSDANVPPAPSITDAGHYVNKYGFDWPGPARAIGPAERARLMVMLPFALTATARWDARFGDSLEPQMLLFWTHAEGITGHISYSNCANEYPPAGYSYFSYITNCNDPGFWQLGFGNQFGVIAILKTAFGDMHGDPNDPRLVQHIGQAVIDWDRRQGTSPVCGGYSCTFPAMTIDQIMAGVSLTHPTEDDWWASVLSRDPAINCYMLADALIWFNHNATRNWVGCYYAEPCWSYESNSLGDILAAWGSLRAAAGV